MYIENYDSTVECYEVGARRLVITQPVIKEKSCEVELLGNRFLAENDVIKGRGKAVASLTLGACVQTQFHRRRQLRGFIQDGGTK